ncbi:MAG: peptidoglycan binding protein CsiV [Candidatus Polarisedimenticolaceae bacterium]|nr:peptidoglycan binding protein CsiV [Candidatus Polarisedimenticolaceae bacterium]
MNYLHLPAILLLLTPALLWADEEPAEAPPWYEFELIIYTNQQTSQNSNEFWSSDPGQPSALNTVPLAYKTAQERKAEMAYFKMSQRPEPPQQRVPSIDETVETVTDETNPLTREPAPLPIEPDEESSDKIVLPIAYQQLPDTLLELGEVYSKLSKIHGRIEPLVHMAWRQQVKPPESAETLYLILPTDEAEQTPGLPDQTELPQLEGSIKISIKRYLHIDIDMVLRRLITPLSTPTEERTLTTLSPHYQAYRMQMHRRMRSKELHYLDHPLMSILIIARRYEIPQATDKLEATATNNDIVTEQPSSSNITVPSKTVN